MHERIKQIRKALKLNQTEFGIKIGLKQRTIADIESGRNTLTERNFEAVCRVFNVNPEWLRHEIGEMFMPQRKSQYLDLLIEEYGLNDEHRAMIESILELPPEVWSSVIDWIKNCAAKMQSQSSNFVKENRRRELETITIQAKEELAEMGIEYVDSPSNKSICPLLEKTDRKIKTKNEIKVAFQTHSDKANLWNCEDVQNYNSPQCNGKQPI